MADVGTKLVFEDERIKVWEFFLEAGEQTECHTHELDYVFYVVEGAPLQVLNAEGEPTKKLHPRAGDVVAYTVADGKMCPAGGGPPVSATHAALNTGRARYREILIETKR